MFPLSGILVKFFPPNKKIQFWILEMQRRVYGEENELGAMFKRNGRWESSIQKGRPRPLKKATGQISSVCCGFQENGGRILYDVEHVEYATPEASLVRELVLASRGCERLVEELFPPLLEDEVRFIKDGTDGRDSVTYATHENYLFDPSLLFEPGHHEFRFKENVLNNLVLFLISRIVITGGGGISADYLSFGRFLISHRARFINKTIAPSSHGASCPLISSKFDPLGEGYPYQRLHIPCGDPSVSEFTQYLKYGITALVLRLAEDGALPFSEGCLDPISTIKQVSDDTSCQKPLVRFPGGQSLRALDVLRAFLDRIKQRYPADDDPLEEAGETQDVINKTEETLDKLETDPMRLDRELDWVIQKKLMERYLAKLGMELSEFHQLFKHDFHKAKEILNVLRYVEQRYHELSPGNLWRELSRRSLVTRILTDEEIEIAKTKPPGWANPSHRNRSWARGNLVKKMKELNVGDRCVVDWTRVGIDVAPPHFTCPKNFELNDPFAWDLPEVNEFLETEL